jgi:hypothetical protein
MEVVSNTQNNRDTKSALSLGIGGSVFITININITATPSSLRSTLFP